MNTMIANSIANSIYMYMYIVSLCIQVNVIQYTRVVAVTSLNFNTGI